MSTLTVDKALDALLDPDQPRVTAPRIAEIFGLHPTTVIHAIRVGKLAADVVEARGGRATYGIRPRDAALIWGYRLRDQNATTA